MTGATFYPGLLYADADAAIEWLERTFGFERREVHRAEDESGIGREPFRSLPAGKRLVYCATDGVEAFYERAREAGAEIALELSDTDYGSRDFTARDPEGTLWSFGTYRPAV
jgi:uncharacterized glyoxalase superfamily protein PhnB